MVSLTEIVENKAIRTAEIARLRAEQELARREKRSTDVWAIKGVLQVYTDIDAGIERCYECGKIKRRRKITPAPAAPEAKE